MALLFQKKLQDNTEIAVWKIDETETFFINGLSLLPVELSELNLLKGRRRLEWLASRYLVHLMLTDLGLSDLDSRIPLIKDTHGKPYLENSGLHVSFSHSHEMAAAILSHRSVGIDIQYFVSKIEIISQKYLRNVEASALKPNTRLQQLHIFWGAKESMYKSYGKKELDFRDQIMVDPFDFEEKGSMIMGKLEKNGKIRHYEMAYEMHGLYFLVWALEID